MVLQGDLGRILHLRRRAVQHRAETGGGHGGGRADLSLAAGIGAGNRRIGLDQAADGRGGEQEFPDPAPPGVQAMVEVVAHHGRNYAGRAVGGRGDHLASAGVFFVDRHGVDGEPVGIDVRLSAVGALLVAELFEQRARPPLHAQPAGELALA